MPGKRLLRRGKSIALDNVCFSSSAVLENLFVFFYLYIMPEEYFVLLANEIIHSQIK